MDDELMARGRRLLAQHFGFQDFRAGQVPVVRAVLAGGDVLAVLPTGAGKSVCFQVPALISPGVTLVISPLISLMQDQVEAAVRRGMPAALINSTLDAGRQREVIDRVSEGACRLLYVAPERLPRLASELAGRGIRPAILAVDEAHCISEWGHDFRPAYRSIRAAREALGWPQTIALTGSATRQVRDEIVASLGLGSGYLSIAARPVTGHVGSFDRPNLWFGVGAVKDERARLGELLRLVEGERGARIVYVSTRNIAEALARILWQRGVRTLPYHAGLTKPRRAETLRRFLDGDVSTVVATCAFGMGIDKPDVRLVVHWTMPPTPESYYQEAGRAGRDGQPARCLLLYRHQDAVIHRRQLDVTFPPEPIVERAWGDPRQLARLPSSVQTSVERLRVELARPGGRPDWSGVRTRKRLALTRLGAVERYATDHRCRRRALIGWFGERLPRCSGCDRCGSGPR
jgi:ATP-dependent DNA helicase RecQ